MPKATKKKPMSKAVAAALKAVQNMVFETVDLDAQLKQVTEKLSAAGIGVGIGSIVLAGRDNAGNRTVQINIGSRGYSSPWPEWAYGVAEGALRFNKRVLVVYNDDPFGSNLLQVLCMNTPA